MTDVRTGASPSPRPSAGSRDALLPRFADATRPVVCVQGLGFVGAAMAVAVASARDARGRPAFNVVGVDLPTDAGRTAIAALNEGRFPSVNTDARLATATRAAREAGNLVATHDERWYGFASVIVCDINLDLVTEGARRDVRLDGFEEAVRTIGAYMRRDTLVIVETTVPPGTCEYVVAPILSRELRRRGENPDGLLLAHSFERVMPGPEYLDSIVNFWRVYAGRTPPAAAACRAFLEQVINTRAYPLTELHSPTASELAKLMENSYRAANIAFVDEWRRFAEIAGVDLFEVVDAIRVRPTHSNIRNPGFGVGGYCLTKDPLFAGVGARRFFGRADLRFPFSEAAVATNEAMPRSVLDRLEAMIGGVRGRSIALLGVSYRSDISDTRYSPSEIFARAALERGARIVAHDPLVSRWTEMGWDLDRALPHPAGLDAVVFAVAHGEYRGLDVAKWLGAARPAILDGNGVLSPAQRAALRSAGHRVESVGRGHER